MSKNITDKKVSIKKNSLIVVYLKIVSIKRMEIKKYKKRRLFLITSNNFFPPLVILYSLDVTIIHKLQNNMKLCISMKFTSSHDKI